MKRIKKKKSILTRFLKILLILLSTIGMVYAILSQIRGYDNHIVQIALPLIWLGTWIYVVYNK